MFVILATALLACIPLTGRLESYFFLGSVFGDEMIFGHTMMQQFFEARVNPIFALIFFIVAFFVLLYRKEAGMEAAKIFFAAGMGPMSFGLGRFIAFQAFADNPLWAESWEELTEFCLIFFLFWIFFPSEKSDGPLP